MPTMLAVPRKGDCSKVSMEFSRYTGTLACLLLALRFVCFVVTHIERRKLRAVRIEGLVVVLGELLYIGAVSMSHTVD